MACWRKAPPFSASRSRSACCSRPCAARSMRRGRRDGVRVLIVEDDPELAGLLRDGLRAQRIDPTLAATVGEGRDRAALSSYDVIILDVRLPGGSGFELCGVHQGRVLDRSTITAHVWDDNHDPFANVLEVLIRRLRRKIDDGFEPKLITTLRGAGYRFGT